MRSADPVRSADRRLIHTWTHRVGSSTCDFSICGFISAGERIETSSKIAGSTAASTSASPRLLRLRYCLLALTRGMRLPLAGPWLAIAPLAARVPAGPRTQSHCGKSIQILEIMTIPVIYSKDWIPGCRFLRLLDLFPRKVLHRVDGFRSGSFAAQYILYRYSSDQHLRSYSHTVRIGAAARKRMTGEELVYSYGE